MGESGATIERPALTRLLARVAAGGVDDDALCDTSFDGIGYALQVEMLDEVTPAARRDADELNKAGAKRPPRKKVRAE